MGIKIDCISDIHGLQPYLPGGDLLIVAGDLTARDTLTQHSDFLNWVCKQDYKDKVVIAGNHDMFLANNPNFYSKATHRGIHYLCDSMVVCQGFKIWGSPASKWFSNVNPRCRAFMGNETYLEHVYYQIPDDVDILITHGPPYTILDSIEIEDRTVSGGVVIEHLGSSSLLHRLEKIKPRLHVFGHIHEHGGKELIYKRPGVGDENNTLCVNASIMGGAYTEDNEPVRVIL